MTEKDKYIAAGSALGAVGAAGVATLASLCCAGSSPCGAAGGKGAIAAAGLACASPKFLRARTIDVSPGGVDARAVMIRGFLLAMGALRATLSAFASVAEGPNPVWIRPSLRAGPTARRLGRVHIRRDRRTRIPSSDVR